MYLVYVYYNPKSDAIGATEGPGFELYETAGTDAEAIEKARLASVREALRQHPHEYAVEGGHYPAGGWENPVFRAGLRLR